MCLDFKKGAVPAGLLPAGETAYEGCVACDDALAALCEVGMWGLRHGAWGMGMGHGAWGMGHGAWGMGHGAWGMGLGDRGSGLGLGPHPSCGLAAARASGRARAGAGALLHPMPSPGPMWERAQRAPLLPPGQPQLAHSILRRVADVCLCG
jgi:hypothetical protein